MPKRDKMEMLKSGDAQDVLQMLRDDHEKVKSLFQEFEEAEDSKTKQSICEETLLELKVHAQLEEEVFYPAVRAEIEEEDIMDEAVEEHHVAKMLISELEEMDAEDDQFEAKFTVLGEVIDHHVQEEEGEMFAKVEDMDLDFESLAQEMTQRKEELMEELGSAKGKASNKRKAAPRAKRSPAESRR